MDNMENEIWRECVRWLTRCGALRPDHKLNWSDATILDFAYTLRDGVLLCNLLNILHPGSIDMKDVSQKPQMAQFLCLRNIKTFLQACQDVYDLKESDLFEPSVLFDLSDFYKVLLTLSVLSNCSKLEATGITGYFIPKVKTSSEEDIYRNLNTREVLIRKCSNGIIHDEYSAFDNHIHEEVYHHLCSIKKRNTILSHVPVPTVPSLEKRDYVINELLETEKNYVDVLSSMQTNFMRPFANLLREDDYNVIFYGIKELLEVHAGFHNQLRKACTPCSTLRLSEIFLTWRHKFLIYGDYCVNLTLAQARIQDICLKNDAINQEVNRCQQEASNGKFKLRDILSVPMQRILKYHLLLDKLLTETQPHHEDFRGLERAKEAMIDVAQYINEIKRDSDALNIIKNIQISIIDWNQSDRIELKDCGRLLKDGEIRVRSFTDPRVKARYVFVFDKILILCKSLRGDQYSLKETLILNDFTIEETVRRPVSRDHSARWSHQFHLVSKIDTQQTFTFHCRTDDIKKKWIKAIQEALDNIEPQVARHSEHKFVLHTFEKPTICNFCSKYLKGRILQGYRCTSCFIAVHKGCIVNSNRCGIRHPPEIPPRPPLILTLPKNSISPARTPTELHPVNPLPPDWNQLWTDQDFLSEHLWFVGAMGRERATALLEQEMDGTFLVRIRPQGAMHPNESIYALSLKTDGKVKHMKVSEKKINGVCSFYLSESRFFPSLVDLVNCYEQTSLEENFMGLNVRLQWPFRRIIAIAEFDFNPTESNQLPLKKGCQVLVLSKEGDHKGWWKGQINDRIGFFPKVYVREVSDTFHFEDN